MKFRNLLLSAAILAAIALSVFSFEAAGEAPETAESARVPDSSGSPSLTNASERPFNRVHTIILIDQLNTACADLTYARDNVLSFLEQHRADEQPSALMSVELHGLIAAQDYTSDRKLLKEKLMRLTALKANSKGNMDRYRAPEYAQAALSDLSGRRPVCRQNRHMRV